MFLIYKTTIIYFNAWKKFPHLLTFFFIFKKEMLNEFQIEFKITYV